MLQQGPLGVFISLILSLVRQPDATRPMHAGMHRVPGFLLSCSNVKRFNWDDAIETSNESVGGMARLGKVGGRGANRGVTLGGATGAVRPTAEPWDEERVMAEPWGRTAG
jgi:hypothetical protein